MKRYDLIDTLRGLAVLSMICFHACWIVSYFGLAISQETLFGPWFTAWERSICISFITIAGFSFSYGQHHLKSGLTVFTAGLLITVVTCLFVYDIRIIFGVLTFIGTATLIMIPIDKTVKRLSEGKNRHGKRVCTMFFLICIALFFFTYNINKGFLGISRIMPIVMPEGLYRGYIATFLGFMDPGFYSSDYFSFIPWFFLYMSGYFLHKIISGTGMEEKVLTKRIPGIRAVGRHSLLIYIIHPILIFIIVWLLKMYMI